MIASGGESIATRVASYSVSLAGQRPSRRLGTDRLVTFAVTFAAVLVVALRAGSYDIVVRQENGLVIWWVLALGVALGLLPRARLSPRVMLLLGALAAYAIWTGLSLTWTESAERTTAEVARVLDYLGLVALAVFVLDRFTWRSAIAGLVFGALAICALAVGSRLHPAAFPADGVASTFKSDRLDYPFGYWNAVGAWGAMSAALGLVWSAHDTSRARRATALALVPVAGLATYLTYSRAGIAAVALAIVAVLTLSRHRLTSLAHCAVASAATALAVVAVRGEPQIATATGTRGAGTVLIVIIFGAVVCAIVAALTAYSALDEQRLPRQVTRVLAGVLAVVLVGAAAVFGPSGVSRAWRSFRQTTVTSTSNPAARLTTLSGNRYDLWRVALQGFSAHPVTGTGAGTFEFWWNRHQRTTEHVRNAHSLWLENLSELGAPGLVLILAVAGSALAVAVSVRRRTRRTPSSGPASAVLAMFLVFLLSASVDWMWQSTAVTVLALGGVAILGARLSRRGIRLGWRGRSVLVGLALVASAVQLPGLIATKEIQRSQAAERKGDSGQAVASAGAAVAAEPWAASGYVQRGLVEESGGRLAAAAADLRAAVTREPTNYANWLLLARVQTERGLYTDAVGDLRQAKRLRPLDATS